VESEDARYWRTLYEVSMTLNSSLELSEVLKQTVRLTADAMDAKACSLRLLDESEKNLELVAAYGLSDAYVLKGLVELEKSKIDREVMEGRVLAIADAAEDPRLQYPEEARKEGIRSVLSSPLSVRGKTIGTIRVYTAEPHEFTDREIQFLSALASQAALAIDNAKLHMMCLRSYQEAVQEAWKKTDVWGSGEAKQP
jgi:signal transduction protein with GAF and PtsI domain